MADQKPPEAPKDSKPHPPGVVLGPDGKPCKPCTAFRNWRPVAAAKAAKQGAGAGAAAAAASGTAATLVTADQPDAPPAHCPPDVEQLGRSTWTFLHTTAAYYPDRPTPLQRANMLNLLHSLPVLYPCSHCASHLGEELKAYPPDVSGRIGLSRWLCDRHNEVNERLGKPKFDCSIKSTDERWKDGPSDGSCD
ncbi:FAD-dependent thiol oxidase [Punctularia strigosozonata HHB-11173 SS5]|uniref:FAD-dependent thiol oxidase n=1 Tax=Punctularia strigosozonata (strain HHB-11173) TaxID=741275 RepID=UPI0004416628|nr:FAD-dependent thiol oxidase [Punctularia strigosozonata HHB-11173 SS5]EIN09659.1 FAD-dependent thiol oxidase [Punctularia strigosozonata HHB-11173 SS5]